MREFIHRFLTGRYGPDHLGVALIAASVVIGLVSRIFGLGFLMYVSYVPLVFALTRLLSRDITSRRRENDRFLRFYSPLRVRLKRRTVALREIKTHKYFKCPACKNMLRVPRGKGKIWVTCPKCGERFTRNSGKPWK